METKSKKHKNKKWTQRKRNTRIRNGWTETKKKKHKNNQMKTTNKKHKNAKNKKNQEKNRRIRKTRRRRRQSVINYQPPLFPVSDLFLYFLLLSLLLVYFVFHFSFFKISGFWLCFHVILLIIYR